MSIKTPSASQVRAAMGLLNWQLKDVTRASGVSIDAVSMICLEKHEPQGGTRLKLRMGFERAGIEFLDGDGVRRISRDVETFVGRERFQDFMQFFYDYLKANGGEVLISVTDERMLQGANDDIQRHRLIMRELTKDGFVTGRILAGEGNFKQGWAKVRQRHQSEKLPHACFYVFGPYIALISFTHDPSPYVVLMKISAFAAQYRQDFDASWEKAK